MRAGKGDRMKKAVGGMVALVLTATVAMAGTMKGMQAWAEKAGPKAVETALIRYGITNEQERAQIIAEWDEATVVEAALRQKAFSLVELTAANHTLSARSLKKIKAAILSEKTAPAAVWTLVGLYPVEDRDDFGKALESVATGRYAATPEYGRLAVKYLIQGVPMGGAGMSEEDMVRWLLAGEVMDLGAAQRLKETIKERAVKLARLKLRAEGKTFVTRDGVNPMVGKTAPVIEALNRAECAGIEDALRDLGCKVPNVDRTELRKVCPVWQEELMRGDRLGAGATAVLGRLSVFLGAEGYNRFVDDYNLGTGRAQ